MNAQAKPALDVLLGETFHQNPDPLVIVSDPRPTSGGHIIFANRAFMVAVRPTEDDLSGVSVSAISASRSVRHEGADESGDGDGLRQLSIKLAGGGVAIAEFRPLFTDEGQFWTGTLRRGTPDVEQRDPVTGLPNAELFKDRLHLTIAHERRVNGTFAVMLVSIGGIDRLVETHGRDQADGLFGALSLRLRMAFRESDTIARLSEECFALLLPIGEGHHGARLAQKVKGALVDSFQVGDATVTLSPSIGIALFPDDGGDPGDLVSGARRALQKAEDDGGHSYRFASDAIHELVRQQLRREIQMRWALDQQEFLLFYQPLITADGKGLAGAEALLRWQHPDLGLIPPRDFISVAEETSLIVPIGEWVLRQACFQVQAWTEAGLNPVPIAVNLSPMEVRRTGLVRVVEAMIRESRIDPHMLCLELPQPIFRDAEFLPVLLDKLDGLKQLGVSISIDNYGTGDVPLGMLERLPIDRINIDRSLVQDDVDDQTRLRVARAAVAMAHSLGLKVVAQGVESESARALFAEGAVDAVQGFLVSEPIPAEHFAQQFLTEPA